VINSTRMRWAGHVARMGESRVVYTVLVGKPEGKRPLWRPRRRWEVNIKSDIQEIVWGGHELDCSGWGWRQVVGTCKCGSEPSGSITFGEVFD
jgi:hypothetical protein